MAGQQFAGIEFAIVASAVVRVHDRDREHFVETCRAGSAQVRGLRTDQLIAHIFIDPDAAMRAGNGCYGSVYLLVDPAALTKVQRKELHQCRVFWRRTTANDQKDFGPLGPELRYVDPYSVPFEEQWDARGVLDLPAVSEASVASLAALLDARPGALEAYRNRGAQFRPPLRRVDPAIPMLLPSPPPRYRVWLP